MMEQLKEILDKIPAMLLLAVILGYLGYGHYEFISDPSSALLQKQSQVEAAQKQKAEEAYAREKLRLSKFGDGE